jgi:hypothetical protein
VVCTEGNAANPATIMKERQNGSLAHHQGESFVPPAFMTRRLILPLRSLPTLHATSHLQPHPLRIFTTISFLHQHRAMSSLASTTAPSPFPIPESSPKPTRRSLKSRVRAAIVLGVITSYAGVQPCVYSRSSTDAELTSSTYSLAYIYTLWSAAALLPRGSLYGVAAPPSSMLHFALLSYFLVETIFGIIYHILAFKVSSRRPDLSKDAKSIRSVVRTVLASGMSEPGSPSLSACSSVASSR